MEGTAFVYTSRMPKPVITFGLKLPWKDCFRPYFTHAQACDNVRVQRQPRNTVYSFKLKRISVVCLGQRPHNRTGKVVACPKAFSTAMAKAAANLKGFALVLQGVLKNKEGEEEKEEEVERPTRRARRKGPLL